MIDLNGPPLCPECGVIMRRVGDEVSVYTCHKTLWRFDTARAQAPHHSAEIECLRTALDTAIRERNDYKHQRDNARRAEADATSEADGLQDRVRELEAQLHVNNPPKDKTLRGTETPQRVRPQGPPPPNSKIASKYKP